MSPGGVLRGVPSVTADNLGGCLAEKAKDAVNLGTKIVLSSLEAFCLGPNCQKLEERT